MFAACSTNIKENCILPVDYVISLQLKRDGTRWRTGGGEGWRGNWRMEWVASTLHTTSEHVVCSITTADAHTSAASSRLNWRPRRFKWIRPFLRETKSGFCACAITFQPVATFLIVFRINVKYVCNQQWPRGLRKRLVIVKLFERRSERHKLIADVISQKTCK